VPHTTVWSDRGVTWTFWGTVSGKELIEANQEVYEDERFRLIRFQVVDLTQVERFDVTPADMRIVARNDHAAARLNPSVRVAVAATDEMVRVLSLYYEGQISDSTWDQQVFDTPTAAKQWAAGEAE
jgi:head-tail adaptor